jgi:protein tyrosine/serine phosphatase
VRELKELGVKTIVNLESFHSDRDEIGRVEIGYEHLYVKPWHPEDTEAVRFLEIVTDEQRTPVFVHCAKGADRTGMMCALYRVAVSGWTKEEAIEEMTRGGFGYHRTWSNLVRYIEDLDIADISRRAGINPEERQEAESGFVEGH